MSSSAAPPLPIENYSVVQPSTQQRTYTAENICRFSIPSNTLGFIDPHTSYLRVDAQIVAPPGGVVSTKYELNGDASSVIEYIRFSCGGQVLEEVDEYNALAHIKATYGEDDSSRATKSIMEQGQTPGVGQLGDLFCSGFQGDCGGGAIGAALPAYPPTSNANGLMRVKLIIPLTLSGLFGQKTVLPLAALGSNLEMEIRFAPDTKVLQTYCRGRRLALCDTTANGQTQLAGFRTNDTSRTEFRIAPPADASYGNFCIPAAATFQYVELALPSSAYSCLGDVPLMLGQHVQIRNSDGTQAHATLDSLVVGSITRVATVAPVLGGAPQTLVRIRVGLLAPGAPPTINPVAGPATGLPAAAPAGVEAAMLLRVIGDASGDGTLAASSNAGANAAIAAANIPRVNYSRPELYLQRVTPPAQYVQAMMQQIASPEGFSIDVPTFTTYKSNVIAGAPSQTIEIPASQSRALSVLVALRAVAQNALAFAPRCGNVAGVDVAPGVTSFDYKSLYQNLRDYQWQLSNGIRVPTRPVRLDVMIANAAALAGETHFQHISAEHLIQISQALAASSIGVQSIKLARQDFIIGRQLSKYGGTTPLDSQMRLYLNYAPGPGGEVEPQQAMQSITFVNHVRRVVVNASGLTVFD